MTEIWKAITNYEELYEVSNLGRVKSIERKVNNGFGGRKVRERILKNIKDGAGYEHLRLCKDGHGKTFRIHRLVAIAFISNPQKKPEVNHKNGVKTNNFWKNLEWTTPKENSQHAWINGLSNNDHSRKKVAQIKDGIIYQVWDSSAEACRCLGIIATGIANCCHGRAKSAGGFQWKLL